MKLNLLNKCLMVAALTATLFGISCEPKKTKQIAIVYDPSKSKIEGCDCLAGVLEKTLESVSNSGAKIIFFKLGDLTTGFEPKVVNVYELPKNRRVTEGKAGTVERTKEIVADFRMKCHEIERTNDTPLMQALSKVIGFLKQNGCDENLACQIILQTDLQESIQNAPQEKVIEKITNEGTQFDNSGITVSFYGVSEVEENVSKNPKEINKIVLNARSRVELKNVWKQKFVDPNLVKFFDFCTFESSPELMTKKD
jgi:hypothetical protein